MTKIAIIDYGMGNLRSVAKAVEKVGAEVLITNKPEIILSADKLILPGVGAFRDCINNLQKLDLVEPIKEFINTGKFFLGICLGMHVLFEVSYEFGEYKGLGILKGKVKKFENLGDLSIPHMGWNIITIKKETPLLSGLKNGDFFYFAHSYYVEPLKKNDIMTLTDYGIDFTSSVNRENVYGVQFHPEKSQKKGLIILENFLNL